MPEHIEFPTYDGRFKLRGRVYLPSGARAAVPAVVMSGGFADSWERMIPTAEAVVEAGFGVLVYEHRNTGISEGEPRLEIDPIAQVRDMGMAITFAQTVTGFDPNRIGLFGTSFSGGHVLAVAAEDRRVKVVVSSNPWVSGYDVGLAAGGPRMLTQFAQMFEAEQRKTIAGDAPTVVTLGRREDDPSKDFALFRDDAAMDYYEHGPEGAPASWQNGITLRSLQYAFAYDLRPYAARISPIPLMMLVGLQDHTMPAVLGLSFFESALEPKELVTFQGGHYDAYMPDKAFPQVMNATIRWFKAHL